MTGPGHDTAGGADEPPRPDEELKSFAEEADSLWHITFAPLIWAVHFGVGYAATAIACARAPDPDAPLDGLRLALGALTLAALVGIGWVARHAWRRWDFLDDRDYEHEAAIEEDRHEFLGHAGFLLAIISFIGVLYVAMPALLLESCR